MARVCVVRQAPAWSPRVLREVKALAESGHEVQCVCVGGPGTPLRERRGQVTTWRLRVPYRQQERALHYLVDYGVFLAQASLLVGALHLRRRFDLVQVNTLPDLLVLAAAVPRALGARVLLDLQECMPEFYATKFRHSMRHPVTLLVCAAERLAIRVADHVITPTPQLRQTFAGRGADAAKIDVVYDGSDPEVFRRDAQFRPRCDRFVLISHGSIEERYGLDTAVRAVGLLREDVPEVQLRIVGRGSYVPELHRLVDELDLREHVEIREGFLPERELVQAIGESHVGIVAMKRDAFRDVTLTCKMFDFLQMGVPVAVSRTRAVQETLPADAVEFFDSDDPEALACALRRLHASPEHRDQLARRAQDVATPLFWPAQRRVYLDVVDRLLGTQSRITV